MGTAEDTAQIAIFAGAIESDMQRAYEALQKMPKLKGCNSYIQRQLGIGYKRACILMDLLEEAGIIAFGDDNQWAWTV